MPPPPGKETYRETLSWKTRIKKINKNIKFLFVARASIELMGSRGLPDASAFLVD